jgi:peptide deformylase
MDGRDARCFLHEFDHLQGNLYIDLASELKLRRAYNKREKLFRKITKPIRLTKNLEKQKNS